MHEMAVGEEGVKPFVMNNYVGFGVDAAIALDFHRVRSRGAAHRQA